MSMSSRAIVEKVKTAPKKEADAYRAKLRASIKRVLKQEIASCREQAPMKRIATRIFQKKRMQIV